MSPDSGPPAEEEILVVQRRPRWLPVLLAAVLVVGAVVAVVVVHATSRPSATATHPVPTSSSTPTTPSTSSVTPAELFGVTELDHPLLGVTGPYELFGRGDRVVVRIELARGRITTTTIPTLNSSGPVYFALGTREAIIRPLDFVPGYVVPDEQPARPLLGPLLQSGPILPSPDPDHVWTESDNNSDAPVTVSVGLDDARAGAVLPMPRGASLSEGVPDGAGYVLFPGTGGTYDARPDGLRRVTTGTVLAVGPTRWLARECDGPGYCILVVIDQASGARHQLRTSSGEGNGIPGVISPDGAAAAFIVLSPSPALEYVDLRTGAEHVLSVPIDPSSIDLESLVWSPDSRWLFAVDAAGDIRAVDARTRRITDFRGTGAALPSLRQIAIR